MWLQLWCGGWVSLVASAVHRRGAGASLQLIGKALGHTQIKTTERYAHLRDDPLAAMVDRIGEAIEFAARPSPRMLLLEHSPQMLET